MQTDQKQCEWNSCRFYVLLCASCIMSIRIKVAHTLQSIILIIS